MNHDPVNPPSHYCTHPSGVECIEITRKMNFNTGNAFKYLYRCDKKENFMQDVRKSIRYIEDEIARREKFRWKFMREELYYDPRFDGSKDIKRILEWECRYSGHIQWALNRLYAAYALPRSVEPLKSALETCKHILKFYA